jgi:hypothetical protein
MSNDTTKNLSFTDNLGARWTRHANGQWETYNDGNPVDFADYDGYSVLDEEEFVEYAESDRALRLVLPQIRAAIADA